MHICNYMMKIDTIYIYLLISDINSIYYFIKIKQEYTCKYKLNKISLYKIFLYGYSYYYA